MLPGGRERGPTGLAHPVRTRSGFASLRWGAEDAGSDETQKEIKMAPQPDGSESRDAEELEAYVETPEGRPPEAAAHEQRRLREKQQQQRQALEQRQRW